MVALIEGIYFGRPDRFLEMACDSNPHQPIHDPNDEEDDFVVTPWDVTASSAKGVDYEKLIKKFGCKKVTQDLVERFEKVTGHKAHAMLRRGMVFAHRDLHTILDRKEQGKPFFLYTGRGPSSGSLHLGHLVPLYFTKWLQEVLDVPLIIQMTDDEKVLWKDVTIEESKKLTVANMKDIIACGYDLEKTFMFTDLNYMCPSFYENIVQIWKCVNTNQATKIFGFVLEDCMGKAAFPAIEAAPCISSSFPHIFNGRKDIPCLIPCAIDQDPYFRMTRDVARTLNFPKPSLIFNTFLPALQGAQTKMAASDPDSCIYVSDTPNEIKYKINKFAYSGGQPTVEEHRLKGGDCDVDTSFQFLRFFLDNDEELERIYKTYSSGELLTEELKARAVEVVTQVITEFQEKRSIVTDELLNEFMKIRPLKYTY